jgi:Family of unknown function (DUF5678)
MSPPQLLGSERQQPEEILVNPFETPGSQGGALANYFVQIFGFPAEQTVAQTRQRMANSVRIGDRARDLDWRTRNAALLRPYAGQWIAIEGERIVASGADPSDVVKRARAAGSRVPYVFKVELQDDNVALLDL